MLSPQQLVAETQTQKSQKKGRWVFEPAQVLVVDDSLENRELLTLVLEGAGFNDHHRE